MTVLHGLRDFVAQIQLLRYVSVISSSIAFARGHRYALLELISKFAPYYVYFTYQEVAFVI